MNKKNSKRALLSSVLSLAVCGSMLVGTTFAWFTDSVSSVNNVIKAGNLDVELYYKTTKMNDYDTVNKDTNVFTDTLWEPGHAEVVNLKVENAGTLALKYQLGIEVAGEVAGTREDGSTFNLSDYIYYAIVDGEQAYESSAKAVKAAEDSATATALKTAYNYAGTLTEKDDYNELTMIVYMPTWVNNEANYKTGTEVPSINLGINVVATQYTYEEDSFGPDYDENAIFCDVLATPETIDDILADVDEGTIIGLAEGYYDEIILTQNGLTLVAASSDTTVGFVNLNAKDNVTLDNLTFDENGAKATYTFKTGNKQDATGYVANVTGDTNSPKAADNVVIKNCTFTNTSGVVSAAADSYAPIYFNESGAATERASDITVKNCTFACNAQNYIVLNYLSEGEVVIADNTFGGDNYGTAHNTINATANAANWTITGNTFNNWNVEKTAIGSSKQGSNKVSWTIVGNEFNNENNAVVLALKTSYNSDNSVVTVSDNTVLGDNGQIVPTDKNAEDETVYAGHKIQLNEGVVIAADNVQLKDAISADTTTFIKLSAGEYTLPSLANKEGLTIVGAEGTVIGGENAEKGFGGNFGKDTTIKNITFSGTTNGVRSSYAKGGNTTFEDCTFSGDSTYGFHIDQSNGATFTFNNCIFVGFNAFASDLVSVTFNNCTFLSNGYYGHTNIWSKGYFNNCTWGDNTSVGIRGDNAHLYFDGVEESYHHEFIGSAESLVAFAESVNKGGDNWDGQKILLVSDIDLAGIDWEPIGQTGSTQFNGIFDGQNHTIKNLNVDNSDKTDKHTSSGLFGWAEANVTIQNVNIDGATVKGNHNVAVIVGYTYSGKISNCHVSNATVICTHANDDACGDKAGVIAGYAGNESRFTNCSASDSKVTAGRDAGQLIGTGYSVSVQDCTATNVTVSAHENNTCTGNNIKNEIIGRVMD